VYITIFLENFISAAVILHLSYFCNVQVSPPGGRVAAANEYIRNPAAFCTSYGLGV